MRKHRFQVAVHCNLFAAAQYTKNRNIGRRARFARVFRNQVPCDWNAVTFVMSFHFWHPHFVFEFCWQTSKLNHLLEMSSFRCSLWPSPGKKAAALCLFEARAACARMASRETRGRSNAIPPRMRVPRWFPSTVPQYCVGNERTAAVSNTWLELDFPTCYIFGIILRPWVYMQCANILDKCTIYRWNWYLAVRKAS